MQGELVRENFPELKMCTRILYNLATAYLHHLEYFT